MESKKSKIFITNEIPENFNIESFKEMEYTEVSEITNIPPEPVPLLICKECNNPIDYIDGAYPLLYYSCPECNLSFKVELKPIMDENVFDILANKFIKKMADEQNANK